MEKEKPNILFLPTWYPNRDDAMIGLFTRKHADILKDKVNLFVVAVVESKSNKKTYEVETKASRGYTELIIYYKKSKIPLLGRLKNFINKIKALKSIKIIMGNTDFKPDLVHLHTASLMGVLALNLKRKENINYVITEHWSRYLKENNNFKGFFKKKYIKYLVKNAVAMSTVSKYLQKAMQSLAIENHNWRIIPNTVSHRVFKPIDIEPDSNKTRIFHISCFEDVSKNISGILQAVHKLSKKRQDFELIMIGDGLDKKSMQDFAYNELKLSNFVKFTGEIKDDYKLVDLINSCAFSILFSNYETFGIVIPESLACEKPVIGSNGGAIPEILPEKFGKIVEKGNVNQLSEAIDYMIDNHEKFPKEEMRDYVIENFSADYVAYKIIEMYKSGGLNV